MKTIFKWLGIGALVTSLGVAIFYLVRFARIIMLLEDQLSEAVEVHERSIKTLDKIVATPLFYDSPAIKPMLDEAIADIKMCKLATQRVIDAFTSLSKQRYVRVERETPPEKESPES